MVMSCQFGYPQIDTVLAGSSADHELKLFSRHTGKTLASVTGFSGPVIATHMDKQGKTVAVGTKTGATVLLHYGNDDNDENERKEKDTK